MGRNSRAAEDIKVRCEYCSGLASLSESKHIFKGKDHGLVYLCENYKSGCDSYVAVHKGDNFLKEPWLMPALEAQDKRHTKY